jgi:hypothetical protein
MEACGRALLAGANEGVWATKRRPSVRTAIQDAPDVVIVCSTRRRRVERRYVAGRGCRSNRRCARSAPSPQAGVVGVGVGVDGGKCARAQLRMDARRYRRRSGNVDPRVVCRACVLLRAGDAGRGCLVVCDFSFFFFSSVVVFVCVMSLSLSRRRGCAGKGGKKKKRHHASSCLVSRFGWLVPGGSWSLWKWWCGVWGWWWCVGDAPCCSRRSLASLILARGTSNRIDLGRETRRRSVRRAVVAFVVVDDDDGGGG